MISNDFKYARDESAWGNSDNPFKGIISSRYNTKQNKSCRCIRGVFQSLFSLMILTSLVPRSTSNYCQHAMFFLVGVFGSVWRRRPTWGGGGVLSEEAWWYPTCRGLTSATWSGSSWMPLFSIEGSDGGPGDLREGSGA